MRRNLFLLSELVRRDLAVRYAGSFGGAAWALLNPLILCGLYSFVFSLIVRIPPPADFRGTYTEFLLAGLLPWLGLQDALVRSASAVTDQAHLVRKMSFPVGILVVASLLSALVLQAAGLLVFATLSGVLGAGEVHLLPLAVGFAFQALALAGPAFALAAASVLFRDLAQLIGPLLTVVFYLTPILYPEALVPPGLAWALDLNPVRDLAGLFRAGLLGTQAPPAGRILVWAAVFAVLAFLGHRFFERSRKVFADVL
ncbi:MAG: ABC transporter permease [Holophagales bacterium]|nr:ABC transporter permease [Holophagales bacterium]MBK9967300.1 ABC transporter permease [Holophagales bacterium]